MEERGGETTEKRIVASQNRCNTDLGRSSKKHPLLRHALFLLAKFLSLSQNLGALLLKLLRQLKLLLLEKLALDKDLSRRRFLLVLPRRSVGLRSGFAHARDIFYPRVHLDLSLAVKLHNILLLLN